MSSSMRGKPGFTNYIIHRVLRGVGLLAMVGALEGALTGPLAGILMDGGRPDLALITFGMVFGALHAIMTALPTGILLFPLLAVICRRLPDFEQALSRVEKAAMKGTAPGVAIGGMAGAIFHHLAPMFLDTTDGYILGVVVGFITGALLGGVIQARIETVVDDDEETDPEEPSHAVAGGLLLVDIARDLDQVHVRVAEVDRDDRPQRPGTPHRSFQHLDTVGAEMRDDCIGSQPGDEAEIGRAGRWMLSLRL